MPRQVYLCPTKCLYVCCLMPDISCNEVNVYNSLVFFLSLGKGNYIRYYLILGAKIVTSKTCSATSYNGRNGRSISIDFCFCFVISPTDILHSYESAEYECNLMRSRVYVPSSRSFRAFIMVHVSEPYKSMLSPHALKKASFVELGILDCRMGCSLLHASQACPLRIIKSFIESAT